MFRRHRDDAAFNLHGVVTDFANAVEVQVNQLLLTGMRGAPDQMRFVNIEGTSLDLGRQGPLSLGQLARVIGENEERNRHLKQKLGEWFTASLPAILHELTDLRNPAAHGGALDRAAVIALRNRLIGVGALGQLLQLAQVKSK